jgi:hypothetical protein
VTTESGYRNEFRLVITAVFIVATGHSRLTPRIPRMSQRMRQQLWLAAKTLLALAIVIGVTSQFIKILNEPEFANFHFSIRFDLLIPAGILYFLAQCSWATFWVRLLKAEGVTVTWYAGLRAYFVSQFGKYIPGKVMVILMRVAMLRGSNGASLAVAVTATYETLASMASGALVGVLLLPYLGVLPASVSTKTTALLAIAALPVALGVLNKLAARIAAKKRGPDARPLPAPSLLLLAQGLLHGVCGWCLLGLSLGLVVKSVGIDSDSIYEVYPNYLGAVSLAYVAGFVILVAPGGLGVREFILMETLTPRFTAFVDSTTARGVAIVVALLLRLSWTIVEVVVALTLYFLRPAVALTPNPSPGGRGEQIFSPLPPGEGLGVRAD